MSGFSSAVNAAIGGMTSYENNKQKAIDDTLKRKREKEQYDALMRAKAQEETINDQTIDKNDQILKQQEMHLNMLKDGVMKQNVDITKKNFTDKFNSFIDTYKQYQGKLAKVNPDGTKDYTIPTDMKLAVKDMNNTVVHDPQGADWVNHFMDSKYGTVSNPVVNMDYRPETDELVLTQRSGHEIAMSPALMYNAMGLNKYSTFRHTLEVNNLAAKSEALYKQNKAKQELMTGEAKIQDSKTKMFDAETKRMEAKVKLAKLGNSKEAIHSKLVEYHKIAADLLTNPATSKEDAKPLVTTLMKDKDFTDTLKKDSLYDKANKLKYFSTKTKEFSEELSSLADGVKTGTFDTVNKMFIRYTGKGIDKEEYIKTADLSTRMNLLIMDYLQYKSGAAFGKEELTGYQAAGGILDFTTPEMGKASLQGMAKYLKSKLALDIQAVPNANQRLVLEYNADILPKEAPLTKFNSLKTDEDKIKYLKDLKQTNPSAYEALKKELTNG